MRIYKLKVQNTNGAWATKTTFLAESDKKAYKHAKIKTAETGFLHKAEYQGKVEEPEVPDTPQSLDYEENKDVFDKGDFEEEPTDSEENTSEESEKPVKDDSVFLEELRMALESEVEEDTKKHDNEVLTEEDIEIINEHNPDDFDPKTYPWEDLSNEGDFPRPWWLKNVFVAKDGRVFHQREENPRLYRKLKPTDY